MVWSILIFLIILVVLKGIFNTTIRDNPNSGYKETQNRLKNIIQIQKDSGVYVGISDIDHMAHGIFFLGNEIKLKVKEQISMIISAIIMYKNK